MKATTATMPLFELWLAYAGLLLFSGYVLYAYGVWASLLQADPTMITAVIVLLFAGTSIWVGRRAWLLANEREALERRRRAPHAAVGSTHVDAYFDAIDAEAEPTAMAELLAQRIAGAHESGWWLNGVLLKLGLLGKVIGFSILALQLGSMESFDAGQASLILKNLTGGLGIALLTTITGLAANILLGLQLVRLDRYTDTLVADAFALGAARRGAR